MENDEVMLNDDVTVTEIEPEVESNDSSMGAVAVVAVGAVVGVATYKLAEVVYRKIARPVFSHIKARFHKKDDTIDGEYREVDDDNEEKAD